MLPQLLSASGYLSIFIVPSLLVVGVSNDMPYLAFGVVMFVFPLAQVVFGEYRRVRTNWHEWIATALDRLPVMYGAMLLLVIVWLLRELRMHPLRSAAEATELGLSLWSMMIFATCPAHDLIHRRSTTDARVGRLIAGLAGYPILGHEHLVHHARSGDTVRAEWPFVHESVWQFCARRSRAVIGNAIELERAAYSGPDWRRGAVSMLEAASVTVTAAGMFAMEGGWAGLMVYLGSAIGVGLGMQIVTYLQHWGLGTDSVPFADSRRLGWEDGCRFQAWVTLHLSFHQAHHLSSRTAFYRLNLCEGSPRQPTGYSVLMILSLFPPLWRALMLPVLERWKREPSASHSAGRHLSCFHSRPAERSR